MLIKGLGVLSQLPSILDCKALKINAVFFNEVLLGHLLSAVKKIELPNHSFCFWASKIKFLLSTKAKAGDFSDCQMVYYSSCN